MSSRSPPPLHTPEPSSPFQTTKAQWDILHHYLKTAPASETLTTDTSKLSALNINQKVLATALIKKRAECSLLVSEAKHAEQATLQTHPIHFPNYNVGLLKNHSRSSAPEVLSSLSAAEYTRDGLSVSTNTINSTEHGNSHREARVSEISPLSPTFGPRRNHRFSGTVSRRRSVRHSVPLSPNKATASAQDDDRWTEEALRDDCERRVMWEAAWVEIERNLDLYIERFGASMRERDSKESIWVELVKLKGECEGLKEKMHVVRADLGG